MTRSIEYLTGLFIPLNVSIPGAEPNQRGFGVSLEIALPPTEAMHMVKGRLLLSSRPPPILNRFFFRVFRMLQRSLLELVAQTSSGIYLVIPRSDLLLSLNYGKSPVLSQQAHSSDGKRSHAHVCTTFLAPFHPSFPIHLFFFHH